jgi:hypothetical protein
LRQIADVDQRAGRDAAKLAMSSEGLKVGNRNALCGIISTARQFADREYQQRVWILGAGPEVSSYNEALNTLDDYHISTFLDGDALEQELSSEAILKLRAFAKTLEDFDRVLPAKVVDGDIVALSGWPAVMKSAADFVDSAIEWAGKNCANFSDV